MHIETLNIQHGEKKRATIFAIDISDKEEIVTGGGDGKIVIWSMGQTFLKHSSAVLCVRFSPLCNFIASSSDDKTINIYKRGEKFVFLKKIEDHSSDVVGLCWAKNFLISAARDGFINFYDTENFTLVKKLDHNRVIKGLCIDPQQKRFCVQCEESVKLYSVEGDLILSNEDICKGNLVESFFSRMSFSKDSRFLAVGISFNNKTNSVEILDENLKSVYSLIGHVAPSEVVVFNPNVFKQKEKYYIIAVASQDKSLSLWNSNNHKPFLLLKNLVDSPVLDMCWNKSGDSLFMCTYDGAVKKLQFSAGELGEKCDSKIENQFPLTYEYYSLGNIESQENSPKKINNNIQARDEESNDKNSENTSKKLLKRVKPFIIEPLSEKDEALRVDCKSKLFIFKSIKKDRLKKQNIKNFTKTIKEFRIEYDSQKLELKIFRGEREHFILKNKITHISANDKYVALAYPNNGCDKIKILDIITCNLKMPTISCCGVVLLDLMDDYILFLDVSAYFCVISLKKHRKMCSGLLPFNGCTNMYFSKQYFLVAEHGNATYFYNRNMDVWFNKSDEFSSIYTKKATLEDIEDKTLEELNYRFIVAKEVSSLKKMIMYAKKIFLLLRKQSSINELTEGKVYDIIVSLVEIGEQNLVLELIHSLCRNYSLHKFVYDMEQIVKGLCPKSYSEKG